MSEAASRGGPNQLDAFGADVPLLVISPHLDDAALSAHALLDRGAAADIVTVFTAGPQRRSWTRWDLLSGFADSDEAASARLEEEYRAFAGSPHRLHHLGLRDLQYRGRSADTPEERLLVEWVRAWLDRHDGRGVVAIPAIAGAAPRPAPSGGDDLAGPGVVDPPAGRRGLPMLPRPLRVTAARTVWLMLAALLRLRSGLRLMGSAAGPAAASSPPRRRLPGLPTLRQPPVAHEDHRFVRDVLWKALQDYPDVTVVLYEELPYSWSRGADSEVRRMSESSSMLIEEKRVRVDRVAKSRRIGAYRSQMPVLFSPYGPLHHPDGLPAEERYWVARFEPSAPATAASAASGPASVTGHERRPGRSGRAAARHDRSASRLATS